MIFFQILSIVFFAKRCLSTTCLTDEAIQICSDRKSAIIVKRLYTTYQAKKLCLDGVESLHSNHLNQTSSKDSGRVLKNKMDLNYSILRKSFIVFQISVADPTQKLKKLILKLIHSKRIYTIPILLPTHPRKGDSTIICVKIL